MNINFFKILSYLSFIIYFIVGSFNFFMLFIKNYKLAQLFRVFLTPILGIFYFFTFKEHSIYIYIALLFYFLGDLFLNRIMHKNIILSCFFYIFSLISFLINIIFKINFKNLNYILVCIIVLIYFIITLFLNSLTLEKNKMNFKSGNIYIILKVVLSLFCIFIAVFASQTKDKVVFLILGSNLLFINLSLFSYSILEKKKESIDIFLSIINMFSLLFLILGFGKVI